MEAAAPEFLNADHLPAKLNPASPLTEHVGFFFCPELNLREVACDIPYKRMFPGHLPEVPVRKRPPIPIHLIDSLING